MLMSVIEGAEAALSYPELAGKRVLVTGLTSACGVDIVRSFAEHKCRLVLQLDEESEATQAIAELAAPHALDIKAYGPIDRAQDDVVAFARSAAQAFGGLEVVINLVPLSLPALGASAGMAEVERMVSSRLLLPFLLSKIAANRMGMMLTEGLVLNVAMLPGPVNAAGRAFASVVKGALTSLTCAQAQEWANKGIRFNAIAPPTVGALEPRSRRRAGDRGTGAVPGLGPRQGTVGPGVRSRGDILGDMPSYRFWPCRTERTCSAGMRNSMRLPRQSSSSGLISTELVPRPSRLPISAWMACTLPSGPICTPVTWPSCVPSEL